VAQIVCFEGIDGSGKTTQIELLRTALEGLGWFTSLLEYPVYNSFFGEELGHILAGRHNSGADIDSKSMALWYALDRWSDYQKRGGAFARPDCFVLLNRYTLSSMVYQAVRSNDPECMCSWVEQLEHEELKLPRPDLYIILDVPPIAGRTNVGKKGTRDYVGNSADIYERNDRLQEDCRTLYLRLSEDRDNIEVVPSVQDEVMRPADAIARDVLAALENRGLLEREV